jgi:tight adherence protein C
MRELCILAGFFATVLMGTGLVGYAVLFRRQSAGGGSPLMETLGRIGRAAPVGARESGRLQMRLVRAGYRSLSAPPVYSGIRVASAALIALTLFAAALFNTRSLYSAVLAGLCGSLVGFILPQMVLNQWIRQRSERLRSGLPTALDLMVLGLEAGQSLDAAFQETTRELRLSFPDLNVELTLVLREISAGKSRADAFRNLAKRNDEIELRRLAQVFIDSDRFGTSLAPALRTHTHYLRVRMRQQAREAARKVAVKLVFPVFFLIFPAMLLVTLGPAVLQIVSQLGPMLLGAAP